MITDIIMKTLCDPFKLLLLMILLHILSDFNLQIASRLGDFKQKDWWNKEIAKYANGNAFDQAKAEKMYKHDYVIALYLHSIMWSIITFLPIIIMPTISGWHALLIIGINAYVHAVIDNLKANLHKINLVQDQILHICQIVITICIFIKITIG